MSCERTKAELVDYLSHQLPAAEHEALAAHLAACAACRHELQAAQQLWNTLGQAAAPAPSEHMRPEFYAMLAEFKGTLGPASVPRRGAWQWLRELQIPRPALRLAYGLALVGVGAGGGYWLTNQQKTSAAEQPQLAALAAEVGEMRQLVLLALIDDPSATERLRAVGYTKELAGPDARVVTALLSTLGHDPNVNVRLATLEALAPLADDPAGRLGLVRALPQQESPLVQLALADALVRLGERRSVAPLRALLKQANLDGAVRGRIEQSIKILSTGRPAAPSPAPSHDQTHLFSRPERAVALVI